MRAFRWTPWTLAALFGAAALLAAAPGALADDEDVTVVESTHEMIFVTTPDGQVMRLMKGEDDKWRVVPAERGEADAEGRFHFEGLRPGPVRLFLDEDEEESAEAPAMPAEVRRLIEQFAGQRADVGGTQGDPMPTVLRWLMHKATEAHAGAGGGAHCPVTSWFEGGRDVPLADLRDALKADGWNATRLRQWLQSLMVAQSMPGMDTRGGFGGASGLPWGPMMGGPSWGSMNPWGMPAPGQMRMPMVMTPWGPMPWMGGMGAHPFGQMGGFGAPQVQQGSRTILMWNDGTGWQRREIPSTGPVGVPPGMPGFAPQGGMVPGFGGQGPAHLFRAPSAGADGEGGCDCENCPARTRGQPADPKWIEMLPPEVRNVIGKLMPSESLRVSVARETGTSSCCGGTASVRTVAPVACQCEGDCDCPRADTRECRGTCDCEGNCEDCPDETADAAQPVRVIRRVIRTEPDSPR